MAVPWGVLSDEGGRVTLHTVQGGTVRIQDFASAREAGERSGIGPARLIACDPAVRDAAPTAVLPGTPGRIGAIQQAAPAALLPPAARILIAGALAGGPDWDGIIVLPDGDVTHWVHVSACEIVSFQGAVTGRLAAALGVRDESFDEAALGDTMARPERLATHLNAAAIMAAPARVLGHLLGAELGAMRAYWLGQEVRIISTKAPHAEALALQGVTAQVIPRAQAWQAGLMALGQATGMAD